MRVRAKARVRVRVRVRRKTMRVIIHYTEQYVSVFSALFKYARLLHDSLSLWACLKKESTHAFIVCVEYGPAFPISVLSH